MTLIEKSTISEQIRVRLRDEIVSGARAPDTKLDEVRLSDELGVSRTPLREALSMLERDGLIRREPYRGRIVTRPDPQMIRDMFPVLGALEALAVRQTPSFDESVLDELDDLNARMGARSSSDHDRHFADTRWHERLIAGCGNGHLLELIARQRAFAARFDGGRDRGLADIEQSTAEHRAITQALRAGDGEAAATLLEQHWRNGIETVIGWWNELT